MKTAKIAMLLILMLCTAIAASAAEPLVQEGKTWKHTVSVGFVGHYPSSSEVTMRIGKAEEIHGKTYYPLRDVETNELYAYLRQEGNKVYSCMDIYEEEDDFNGESEEFLVYDFDAKPGDIYESVSVTDDVAVDLTGYGGSYSKQKVTVLSVDNIMINGVERKRMIVEPEYGAGLDYEIIEGIGVNWGYVHLPEFGPFCTGNTALVKINEVADADGNVLFTKADFDAPAYRPLVQEGLVWNTSHEEREYNSSPYTVIDSWYFDAPVKMYGRAYHPFKHKDHIFGYMRQEGDKVYLLVDGENISGIGYYNENRDRFELSTGDEVLIYDFGAKVGDKYMSVSMDEQGVFYAYPQIVEVCVVKADTVMVNGHERRRQYLSIWSDEQPSSYIAVEGIGINIGTVHLPQYIILAGPGSRVFHLDSMTDSEGDVLFTGADFDAPTLTREPLVREGVTWNHVVSYINASVYDTSEFYSLYFDSPVEMYGKMYHPLKNHNSETDVYAYMRQEGNKVYLLVDGGYTQPLEGDGVRYEVGDEVLLYDFDVKEGDEYWSPSIGEEFSWPYVNPWLEKVAVKKVDTVMVNGVLRKRLQVEGTATVSIIEGLGANIGYMHIPGFGPYCACIYRTESNVKDVVDSDGNVIITFEDYNAPTYDAGVPEVGFNTGMTPAKDNKMYDLNGREIRNPLPGTVYIQNGEKHVAK